MTRPNASAHAFQDKLLDFAYGELPADEARRVEQHLQGCSRCSEELGSIRGVRLAVSRLPEEPAPDAGLESLLAYAQQKARQNAAGPEPKASRVRLWLVSLAGVSALGLVAVVGVNMSVKSEAKNPMAAEAIGALHREQAIAQAAPPPSAGSGLTADAQLPQTKELNLLREGETGFADKLATGPRGDQGGGGGLQQNSQNFGSRELVKRAEERTRQLKKNAMRVEVDPQYRAEAEKKVAAETEGSLGFGSRGVASSYVREEPAEEQEVAQAADEELAAAQPAPATVPPAPPPAQKAKAEAYAYDRREVARQKAPSAPVASAAPRRAAAPAEAELDDAVAGLVGGKGSGAGALSTESAPAPAKAAPKKDSSPRDELASLRARVKYASGNQRAELLSRLCVLERQLGEKAAVGTCRSVLKEFAGTDYARRAADALESDTGLQPAQRK